jgi:hypothetical protein
MAPKLSLAPVLAAFALLLAGFYAFASRAQSCQ